MNKREAMIRAHWYAYQLIENRGIPTICDEWEGSEADAKRIVAAINELAQYHFNRVPIEYANEWTKMPPSDLTREAGV